MKGPLIHKMLLEFNQHEIPLWSLSVYLKDRRNLHISYAPIEDNNLSAWELARMLEQIAAELYRTK